MMKKILHKKEEQKMNERTNKKTGKPHSQHINMIIRHTQNMLYCSGFGFYAFTFSRHKEREGERDMKRRKHIWCFELKVGV